MPQRIGGSVMGVKLFVEVMDHWQDWGLTAGERGDLLVIAENANDRTRETYGPIHEPYVLKRAGKSSEASWRNAIGKLMKKGVLKYAVRDGREMSGFPGQFAVYKVVVLCPEAPHDGLHGMCTRPTERVTSQVTQSETHERTGHPTGDPIRGTGHLTGAERVTSQVTPTPLSPSRTTSPPPVAEVPGQRPVDEPTAEGGGGEISSGEDKRKAEQFVDLLDFGDQVPTQQQRRHLVQMTADALKRGWLTPELRKQLEPGKSAHSRLAVILTRLRSLPEQAPVPEFARAAVAAAPVVQSQYVLCEGSGCGRKMLPTPDGLCRECREDGR